MDIWHMEDTKSINHHIVSYLQPCSEYEFRVQVLLKGSRPGPFSATVKTETLTASKLYSNRVWVVACSGVQLVLECEKRREKRKGGGVGGVRGEERKNACEHFQTNALSGISDSEMRYGGGQRPFIESQLQFQNCVIVTRIKEFLRVEFLSANYKRMESSTLNPIEFSWLN